MSARGEAQARRARPRAIGVTDSVFLRFRTLGAEATMSAAGQSRGADCSPSGGSAAAELTNEAASVGAQS